MYYVFLPRRNQQKKCFRCFPLMGNGWITPFMSLSMYELWPIVFSIWYGPIQRDSNFVWDYGFSFVVFQIKTNWVFWKSFEVALLSKYLLFVSYLFFISNNTYSLCSLSFWISLYLLCIDYCLSSSSSFMTNVNAFSSMCKGSLVFFPYTKVKGECPIPFFGVSRLDQSASINFLYQFLWLASIVFLIIWINFLFVDSDIMFP